MKSDAPAAMKAARNANLGTWTTISTPLGEFHLAALDGAIVQTALPGTSQARFLADLDHRLPGIAFRPDPADALLQEAARQVAQYAAGTRRTFDLPLHLEGTAFQQKVWTALSRIPFGEVWSYQDVARAIGRPGASRAVGQANHANPVAPIIPCHRVVNSAGGPGGYGGGMPLKRRLLEHEGIQLP